MPFVPALTNDPPRCLIRANQGAIMTDFIAELTDRLTRYCAIDSQSDADSPTSPSTAIQLDM